MPDEATTRDIALKLEGWAQSLTAAERATVESWMSLGDARTGPVTSTCWWFDPSGAGRPATREGH